MKTYKMLALDVGTSSVRAFKGNFDGRSLNLEEAGRFYHTPVHTPAGVSWNMLGIYQKIEELINKSSTPEMPDSISLDSWGTDIVALDGQGELLTNGVGTQDARFIGLKERFFKLVPRREIYERTGIQFLNWNTIYLLYALIHDKPHLSEAADCFLFAPDYFIYMLTGERICDYTIASTSQMLNPWTGKWDERLTAACGISPGQLLAPSGGRLVGTTRGQKIPLYSGCNHDTAAAVAGVPLQGGNEMYLILGSWIMAGIETEKPIISPDAERYNFSNEGGCDGKIRFLKNCMGMWLFQELQRALKRRGRQISFAGLAAEGEREEHYRGIVDVDDPALRFSGDLIDAVKRLCQEGGRPVPDTVGELVCCIEDSLAAKIAENKEQLELCAKREIRLIRAVGGGTQNRRMCQAIADACGCLVYAGPVEASGYGNLLTQLVFSGEISDYTEGRELLRSSVAAAIYEPR